MLIAVGLITFFGFLRLDNNFRIDERSMRTAITSTVFLSYIILFGTVIFWTSEQPVPSIAETLLVHFTTIVGVVIAAQFGVSAYTEVRRRNETESNTTADPANKQNSEK